MRVVKAGYEIMEMNEGIFKNIEKVARVCYKSEDKICEGSAEKMVRALVKRRHEAMLEHESIYFLIEDRNEFRIFENFINILEGLGFNCMLRRTYYERGVISGNLRMWRDIIRFSLPLMENANLYAEYKFPQVIADIISNKRIWPIIFDDVDLEANDIFTGGIYVPIEKEQLTDEEKLVHYTITVKFTVDRGISHEICRHRIASFAQESTRYVNYSKGQYGAEICVIKPIFFEEGTPEYEAWFNGCVSSENSYMRLIELGRTPQEARDVLPTSTKTEIVMTAVVNEWQHFFNLRAKDITGGAHPQMKEVAVPLYHEMKEKFSNLFD